MELERAVEQTRTHWWWRPGWRHGARYHTFHLTFERCPALRAEAARVGRLLAAVPDVDVVPPQWLHLTMTGVGFVGDLAADRLDRIAQAVLARTPSPDVPPLRFERLYLGREGLSLVPEPASWLTELKQAQEEVVSTELGLDDDGNRVFHPHVSLAYFRGAVDVAALERAVAAAGPRTVLAEHPMLSLLELGRDDEVYTWRVRDQVPISTGARR